MSSAKLGVDLKSNTLGPLVQFARARRAVDRLTQQGDDLLSNDAASRILDDLVSACITLRHVFDWSLEEARLRGKQHRIDMLMQTLEARVVSDICNGSKHLSYGSKGAKTNGPLILQAEGKTGSDSCQDYANSMTIECEGQKWRAVDLLEELLGRWAKVLEDDLGLPATSVTQEGRAEALAASLAERTERQYNVEQGFAPQVDFDIDESGRPTVSLSGERIPLPDHMDLPMAAEMVLRILRERHAKGEWDAGELMLALDSLIIALEGLPPESGVGPILDQALEEWREMRPIAMEERGINGEKQ
ncbi:MAG: hypothetical protein KY455_09685 [Euryarchaeota archaeon]|nr:hypothetical protein [Euryarchaeota archaeon]